MTMTMTPSPPFIAHVYNSCRAATEAIATKWRQQHTQHTTMSGSSFNANSTAWRSAVPHCSCHSTLLAALARATYYPSSMLPAVLHGADDAGWGGIGHSLNTTAGAATVCGCCTLLVLEPPVPAALKGPPHAPRHSCKACRCCQTCLSSSLTLLHAGCCLR